MSQVDQRVKSDANRPVVRVCAHLAVAVALGILADIGLRSIDPFVVVFTAATPWALLAFSAGRAASSLPWSAVAGTATLTTGLASYYLWLNVGNGVSASTLTGSGYRGMVWLAAGVGIGAVAGLAGGCTRRPQLLAEIAWCGAAAVPASEGALALQYGTHPTASVLAFFTVAAVGVLVWALRAGSRPWTLLLGVPIASVVLWEVQLTILQDIFHRLTWI